MHQKYLFGPVNSRRLGRSLGIDLLPFKTCSLDCIYCECGATTNFTCERKEHVPTLDVISELKEYLDTKPELDYVTFSGSGEPTLHSGIGQIIDFVKDNYPEYRVALLTNTTLFDRDDVRRDVLRADVVLPSIDAVFEESFQKVNRPAEGVTVESIIDGLRKFRAEYKGRIIVEFFVVEGVNDSDAELSRFKEICTEIAPDGIQLNFLDRPGVVEWLRPASRKRLEEIRDFLAPLPVQMIDPPKAGVHRYSERSYSIRTILDIIRRRPSTVQDISFAIGVRDSEVMKMIEFLLYKGRIKVVKEDRGDFFSIK